MFYEILKQPGMLPSLHDQTYILLQLYALMLQLSEMIGEVTIVWDILAQEEEN